MLLPLKMLFVVALLSLTGCKDLLSKPLASSYVPKAPAPLSGTWLSDDGSKRLTITKTGSQEWYGFSYQEASQKTEGRFMVSYFKARMVFNVDLATLRIDGRQLLMSETPVYMLFGALVNDDGLQVTPAEMDKFEQNFSKYFFATPINTKDLCDNSQELCVTHFASGNLLLSKRMRKFNDDFLKKYRAIFPSKKQVAFKRV